MKTLFCTVSVLALAAGLAQGEVYMDATDDLAFDFLGNDHLNISSVEVTNDAEYIYFAISMVGDLDATTWGKYVVGLDTGRNAGDNSTDPGSWNRNVDWGRGITDFVGSWTDGGGSGAGAELRSWDGSAWGLTDATYGAGTDVMADDAGHSSGIQMLAISLSALGLVDGDVLEFDVFSTGGGADPGVDHLSRGDYSTDAWANPSLSGAFLSYTINIVPIPSSAAIALLGLCGLAAVKRLRG